MLVAEHQSAADALLQIEQDLEAARETGKFMVAIWSVEGEKADKQVLLRRTTWQFPGDDLVSAANTLTRECKKEAAFLDPAPQPPLPEADLSTLFPEIQSQSQETQAPCDGDDSQAG